MSIEVNIRKTFLYKWGEKRGVLKCLKEGEKKESNHIFIYPLTICFPKVFQNKLVVVKQKIIF